MIKLTTQEREEKIKRNIDRQREYQERRSKQLEEARKQFIEQQKNQDVEREIQKLNQHTSGTYCGRCSTSNGQRATR